MLSPDQEQAFRDHLRTSNARETCPLCDTGRFTLRMVCGGEFLGRICERCGHVLLFDLAYVAQLVATPPKESAFPRTAAALKRRIDRLELRIDGIIQLDGVAIATAAWPTIEVLLDDALATNLRTIGLSNGDGDPVAGVG